MSFLDIINQEKQRLESQSNDDAKVEYPQTKNQKLFMSKKSNPQVTVQILPSADLKSEFAIPVRKVFFEVTSSRGKSFNTNFVLPPDFDHGSLIDNKLAEWAEKGMIPARHGGQITPNRVYLVNVVQIVQDQNGNFVQLRNQQTGELTVQLMEMRESAYKALLSKLTNDMYNTSGSELKFMDVNRPAPVQISVPSPSNPMSYTVDVLPHIQLPPLEQGWENLLEDLHLHATPTEHLPNGDKWAQAVVDMKEGRNPNGGSGNAEGQNTPMQGTNPYQQQSMNQGQQVGSNNNNGMNTNPYQQQGQQQSFSNNMNQGQPAQLFNNTNQQQGVNPYQQQSSPQNMNRGQQQQQPFNNNMGQQSFSNNMNQGQQQQPSNNIGSVPNQPNNSAGNPPVQGQQQGGGMIGEPMDLEGNVEPNIPNQGQQNPNIPNQNGSNQQQGQAHTGNNQPNFQGENQPNGIADVDAILKNALPELNQ